jgi:GDP-L-fucose synthase
MQPDAPVFVAGHRGLVGSAIVRALQGEGFTRILTRSRAELDLADNTQVRGFFAAERPRYVFVAAAKVGGILANSQQPVDFLLENLAVQNNIIPAAYEAGVEKLLFLGSSCIYPKLAPQPIQESALLTGALEPTNEWYAVAKIAGIKLCQAYHRQYGFRAISAMPTNLYGPNDNFDLQSSHVLPALMRKMHEAKQSGASSVTIWGTGTPRREFLHVDDLAGACLHLMRHYESPEIVNVGCGEDLTIAELAQTVKEVVGFAGELQFDTTKPDGTPRKLLDISRIRATGWRPSIPLREGLQATYQWFLDSADS